MICRSGSEMNAAQAGKINLVWDSVAEPVKGYRIYYGTSPGKYRNCVDIGKGSESQPGSTQYFLTGLDKGRTYYIAVNAYTDLGGFLKESDFSNEVSAVAK
jgi:hypothetical protein